MSGDVRQGEATCTVVYLSRGADDGLAAFRRFCRSYEANPAGAPHRVVVAAKGWAGIDGLPQVEQDAARRGWDFLPLPDGGFDFAAYRRASAAADTPWMAFFNTHSEILASGWLALLLAAASGQGVGAAGATASWGTFAPTFAHYHFAMRRQRREMPLLAYAGRAAVRAAILHPLRKWLIWRDWPAFPNPHLRSNAFVTRRADYLAFADGFPAPARKKDAHFMESGRRGFTRFLAARGLDVVVADRHGGVWRQSDWPLSRTFRTPGQPGLLVADNQTRAYAAAGAAMRQIMEVAAWGQEFTPDGDPTRDLDPLGAKG